MIIHETIKNQLVEAMRAKDEIRLNTLRSLISAFSNELISKKSSESIIDDASALNIIKRSVKQHRDSIDQFTKGGRNDLVEKEKAELTILEAFMPKLMNKDDIKKIVLNKISKEGKPEKNKMGQFMGALMKELNGQADGSLVKTVIEEVLN